jgi:hypothetical protein
LCEICADNNVRKVCPQEAQTHTSEKEFACKSCAKTSDAPDLKKHSRTHTDEMPIACKLCAFKIVDQSHFKQHIEPHTYTDKPVVCELGALTLDHTDLQKHTRTDTIEKPLHASIYVWSVHCIKNSLSSHSSAWAIQIKCETASYLRCSVGSLVLPRTILCSPQ